MSRKVELRPAAREEFLKAADWYLRENATLSKRFIAAVRETIESIKTRPRTFPVVYGSAVRRALVRKFPYSVFFTASDERIVVLAFFHDSRNPIIWRGRIG